MHASKEFQEKKMGVWVLENKDYGRDLIISAPLSAGIAVSVSVLTSPFPAIISRACMHATLLRAREN